MGDDEETPVPKAPACCRDDFDSETEAQELAMIQRSAPNLDDEEEVVPVPVSEDHRPMTGKLLHQPMTDDKGEQAKTDTLHQPMRSVKEEKPEQDRGLKRPRSADTASNDERGAVSAGFTC